MASTLIAVFQCSKRRSAIISVYYLYFRHFSYSRIFMALFCPCRTIVLPQIYLYCMVQQRQYPVYVRVLFEARLMGVLCL